MTKSLKMVGLIAFVLLDIVAVVLAVKHVHQTPPQGSSAAVVASASPGESPATTASPSSSAQQDSNGLVTKGSIIATYVSGSCDSKGAQIEVSSDRGKSFQEVALPLMSKADANGNQGVEVTSVLGLNVTSLKELSVIGTDTDCKTHEYVTEDGGQDWKRSNSISDWYIDHQKVGTPAGVVDPECEATSISTISDRNAKVACLDGQIRGTDDVGQTWVSLASLDGLSGASFTTLLNGTAVAKTADCDSRAYSTTSGGATWTPLGCIDKTHSAVAIAGSGGFLVALADGNVYVSTDEGATWSSS